MEPKLWEAVAVAGLGQATATGVDWGVQSGLLGEFIDSLAPEAVQGERIDPWGVLDRVYRAIDESKVDEPYPVVLARELGIKANGTYHLRFSQQFDKPLQPNAIILAPFGAKMSHELPMMVWRHIARYARSYGRPVYMLGDRKSRLDIAAFSEGDYLARQPFDVIMSTIASSQIVIGAANEWTWLAANQDKNIVLLYPDNIAQLRWFWYPSRRIGRAVFTPSNVQTPVILTAIRKFMEIL